MLERRNSLSPPERRDTIDPGAHELSEASEDEHYSDAQSRSVSPARASPIPKTRVERVDDKPAYGEVPGTQAYAMREGDAEPDEIAIISDAANPTLAEPKPTERPPTPGGHPIPKTVVEETPDAEGSVTHPENRQRRKSDARPDVVVKADGQKVVEGGEAIDTPIPSSSLNTPTFPTRTRRKSSVASRRCPLSPRLGPESAAVSAAEDGDDDFGDDFDDFEEGGEDGDFGDFDDGFQQAEETPAPPPPPPPAAQAASSLSFPIPSFEDVQPSDIPSLVEPYLSALFPPTDSFPSIPTPSAKDNPVFLTPRSASLWSQLVAPPPLQPPDWIRSRIRRLFLVSLGVPVDLDEILPASKQKKLVLPSIHRTTSSGSLRRASSDSRAKSTSGPEGEGGKGSSSSTTVDKAGKKTTGGPAPSSSSSSAERSPERNFDLVSARQTCMLTDAALNGMTDTELKEHVRRLEAMQGIAQRVLAYWQKRTDEKIGDREAFEGVIENLVKHARKVRK
ncbi:hypothetical protein VTI74DRAFT_1352 [Chaetomium olivicolor]